MMDRDHYGYPVHRSTVADLIQIYRPKTRKRLSNPDPLKRRKPIRIPLHEYTHLTMNLGGIISASKEAGWVGPHGGVMFQGCEFVPK